MDRTIRCLTLWQRAIRIAACRDGGGPLPPADATVHAAENSVVLGEEGVGGKIGLGNAVILAEPRALFLKKWYEEYRSFRSDGWNEHSIKKPMELARKFPNEVTVLPYDAFYSPGWTSEELQMLYGKRRTLESRATRANHLWESFAWEKYLEDLTPGRVRKIESNFHVWVRPFVSELPDDFGQLPIHKRLAKHSKRRVQSLKLTSRRVATKIRDKAGRLRP